MRSLPQKVNVRIHLSAGSIGKHLARTRARVPIRPRPSYTRAVPLHAFTANSQAAVLGRRPYFNIGHAKPHVAIGKTQLPYHRYRYTNVGSDTTASMQQANLY